MIVEQNGWEWKCFGRPLNRTNLGTPNATVFSGVSINPSAGLTTTLATTPSQIQFG
jgi:hypothetical protein